MEHRKKANRRRNKSLVLRFTEEEYEIIKKKKESSKLRSYTDFIVFSARKIPIYDVQMQPLYELSEQISRIGTNINQIAKVVNTNQKIYENDLQELQDKIKEVSDIVKDNIHFWSSAKSGKYADVIKKIRGGKYRGLCEDSTD